MLTAEWKSQAHTWWARTTRSNTLHPANLHSLLLWSSVPPPQPVPQCRGSFRPTSTPARNFGLQQLLLTLLVWRLKSFAGTRVQGDDPGRWIFQRQQRSKAAIGHRRSIPHAWPNLDPWRDWEVEWFDTLHVGNSRPQLSMALGQSFPNPCWRTALQGKFHQVKHSQVDNQPCILVKQHRRVLRY